MKRSHLLHIGMPKTGTTWLWHQLMKQSEFSAPLPKENYALLEGQSVHDYVRSYGADGLTADFCPQNFSLDRYIIDGLVRYPHIQVCFTIRNPYELHWSLYNFLSKNRDVDFDSYVRRMLEQIWFDRTDLIIKRWQSVFGDRFRIYLYDDLAQDPVSFAQKYFNDAGIVPGSDIIADRILATDYQSSAQMQLKDSTCSQLDHNIRLLQSCIEIDLEHWIGNGRRCFG